MTLALDTAGGLHELPMAPAGDGWFETFADCGAHTRYRYRLDEALTIPDPASRSQPEGADGPSEVIDPRAFTWRHTFWRGRPWEEIALYAIQPGAAGGYDGVRERLPQLAQLGVTALELLAAPQARDDSLPFAPIAAYGGVDALKRLIDEAHGFGLAVLLDLDYARFGCGSDEMRRYAQPFFHTRDDPLQAPPLALDHPQVCDFFATTRCTGSKNIDATACGSARRTASTARGCARSPIACTRRCRPTGSCTSCSAASGIRRTSPTRISTRNGTVAASARCTG